MPYLVYDPRTRIVNSDDPLMTSDIAKFNAALSASKLGEFATTEERNAFICADVSKLLFELGNLDVCTPIKVVSRTEKRDGKHVVRMTRLSAPYNLVSLYDGSWEVAPIEARESCPFDPRNVKPRPPEMVCTWM